MIDRAKSLQTSSGLKNISWAIGDVTRLPYKDDSFTVVTSRYAFHHIEHPDLVLNEMQRVCTVGGMVVVADICVSEDETKAAHFNALERLHDPSHLRALPLSEHIALFESVGLAQPRVAHYKVDFTLSRLLRALGHRPEDARRAEIMVRESIAHDALGTQSRIVGDETIFSYPIAVMAARKTRDSESAT